MDDITAPEDVGALLTGAGCGVSLLATAHGNGQEDLRRRPLYRPLLEEHIFQRVVRIRREGEKFAYEVEEGAV
jgi:stage III sporulation protein AA